jgi:hypothetical protein
MAGDPKNNRKPPKGKVLVKPNQAYSVFQDSNGKLYVLTERNANAALSAVYGDDYGRQIAGFVTTEALNFGISAISTRTGAGTGEVVGTVLGKIVLKGGSKTIGDAIAGEEVSLGKLGYNVTKELTKPSNFAPGAKFEKPSNKVEEALNVAYTYKYGDPDGWWGGLQKFDPSIAKQKIKIGTQKYGDFAFKGQIGALSPGKHVEKAVVGKVKQLFAKPDENPEDKHVRKQIDGFEEVDYENLERLVASGLSESEALIVATNAKTTREASFIGLAKKTSKNLASDVEYNMTGFTYLKRKWEWKEDDEEYRQEMIAFAEDRIKYKYGGKMTPEGQKELNAVVAELWSKPMQRYKGGAAIDPVGLALTAGAGIEQAVSAGYSAIVNLTGIGIDIFNAFTTQETAEPVNTKVTSKGSKKTNSTYLKNNFITYQGPPIINGHKYDPDGFYADRSHLGPVRTTVAGVTKTTAPVKRVDNPKTSSASTKTTTNNATAQKKAQTQTTSTEASLSEKASGFVQLFVKVGFSKFGL